MRPPISIRLTPRQRRQLRRIQKGHPEARAMRRATVVLMSEAGASVLMIRQATGFKERGITMIRKRFMRRGISGLFDRPRRGGPCKGDARFRSLLFQTVQQSPLKFGYGFTMWSAARLAAHMQKETGIEYSPGQLRRILKRRGFIYGRPKHTLKGKRNESKYRKGKKRVSRLKKKPLSPAPNSSSGLRTNPSSISILT